MKKVFLAMVVVFVVTAIALPASAMKKGTFEYGGYTITVVPYSMANPGWGGSIAITRAVDPAVDLSGEYTTTVRPQPVLTVTLAGTIAPPDGPIEVEETWVFVPRETHMVWKVVVAWIESYIAS